jgi:hypothetical protein
MLENTQPQRRITLQLESELVFWETRYRIRSVIFSPVFMKCTLFGLCVRGCHSIMHARLSRPVSTRNPDQFLAGQLNGWNSGCIGPALNRNVR